ncbi:hypothetical protein ACRAWF_27665 [Streptomyces sp. L7]
MGRRRLFQRAQVFVPRGVHPAAVTAIEDEGADVVLVPGSYDEAVRRAAEAAGGPGLRARAGHRLARL